MAHVNFKTINKLAKEGLVDLKVLKIHTDDNVANLLTKAFDGLRFEYKPKDRLLSAQYNLFRPKPAITEPSSKRQRVERVSSQPASVPAATTLPADDSDSAGGGSSNPASSATPMAGSAASNTAGG
ncbi:hypothetical protein Tco_0274886, partial [Tanacetum coccineum]